MISIITPNYNYGRFLDSCIQSVLNQTYTDWELWVCDDGSTDNSEEIVRRYNDSRIHFLPGPHTGGPAAPRNRGIRESKGEFIAFLDADDMLTRDSLEKRLQVMEAHKLDLVCGQTQNVNESTSLEAAYQLNTQQVFYSFCRMPTVMVRRSLIDRDGSGPKNGPFDERLLRYEEKELFIRWLLTPGKKVRKSVLPDIVAYYRVHDQSITQEKLTKRDTEEYRRLYDTYVSVVSEYYPTFDFDSTKGTLKGVLAKSKWILPTIPLRPDERYKAV